MKFLDIETKGTKAYKDYQENLKELKREQRAKDNLPQVRFSYKNLK
jgi:hypothetical protein